MIFSKISGLCAWVSIRIQDDVCVTPVAAGLENLAFYPVGGTGTSLLIEETTPKKEDALPGLKITKSYVKFTQRCPMNVIYFKYDKYAS